MKIYSVFDPEFSLYGQVISGLEDALQQILPVLALPPLPETTGYVPEDPALQSLPAAGEISRHLYGGMPVQLGRCSGHNTRLNCLEYHRDSEFNVGTEDFIILVARRDQMENGTLDTGKVVAFRVPAGVLIECYATTLHFTPCHTDPEKGFRVLIALPKGTNLPLESFEPKTQEDKMLWARNKWMIAHPESPRASQGAYVGLVGENWDIG